MKVKSLEDQQFWSLKFSDVIGENQQIEGDRTTRQKTWKMSPVNIQDLVISHYFIKGAKLYSAGPEL